MALYNCTDASNNAYGAGNYGECVTTQGVGAPNTGVFGQFVDNGSFTILLPLLIAVIVVVIATVVIALRRRTKRPAGATVESPSPSRDE